MSHKAKVQLDFSGLVERLVPRVAELFATLASQDPLKMSFADVAGKTLLDMVEVMQRDGISQEAIAAALGMTIGGFRTKLKKLRETYRESELPSPSGRRPRTLLEQVYAFIDERYTPAKKDVTFDAIVDHFPGVQVETLRGVLKFLVDYELLEDLGRGRKRRYRIAARPLTPDSGLPEVSMLLFREGPMTLSALATRTGRTEASCRKLLGALKTDGSLHVGTNADEEETYRVYDYHIPLGMTAGYEIAILDHISAVIAAVCKKVRLGRHEAQMADLHGGTTFSFDVPIGHPLEAEIAGFLAASRAKMEDWFARSRAVERDVGVPGPDDARRRITIYTGQMVEDL